MERREFILGTCAAFFTTLLGPNGRSGRLLATPGPLARYDADPLPEISAAVDVLVPADPDIPGDFKGTDYHGDRVVAALMGDIGQAAARGQLDKYAQETAGEAFLDCSPEEQIEAIKEWVRQVDDANPLIRDMLTGLLTLSVIGTYENNTPEEQDTLFAAMGWYDPADPAGTFRLPNEGYVDCHLFPASLKKGVR